jgi:hypothetical protein
VSITPAVVAAAAVTESTFVRLSGEGLLYASEVSREAESLSAWNSVSLAVSLGTLCAVRKCRFIIRKAMQV